MGKKFRVSCHAYSEFNNHPVFLDEYEVSLDELDITDEQWEDMTWQEQSKEMELVALQNITWGYQEIKEVEE